MTGTPYYATLTDLTNRWGQQILLQWSDLDGTGSIDSERCNDALLWADSFINSEFLAGGVFTTSPYLSLGPVSTIQTNVWACVIAGVYLYEVRSGRDDYYKNNLRPQLDETVKQLHLAAGDNKNAMGFDAQRRWPVSNAATGYCPKWG